MTVEVIKEVELIVVSTADNIYNGLQETTDS